VQEVIKEAHDGICGAHQPDPKLKDRMHKLGYYWLTMIADAVQYARQCKSYQIMQGSFTNTPGVAPPSQLLHGHLKPRELIP